jgi:hypothetical protein
VWRQVYEAADVTEAHLLRHWLERNGLTARVRGELSACRGELPLAECWPTVWVPEAEWARAQEALRVFRGPQLVLPAWTCPACGEANEPNFGSCWSCQADRPGLG